MKEANVTSGSLQALTVVSSILPLMVVTFVVVSILSTLISSTTRKKEQEEIEEENIDVVDENKVMDRKERFHYLQEKKKKEFHESHTVQKGERLINK